MTLSSTRPGVSLLVNIDVDDLERGIKFYTEGLGLRVGRRFSEPWVELLGAGVPLYLLAKKAGTQPSVSTEDTRSYKRHWTPTHLDFVVDSIELSLELCLRAGAVLESPITDEPYGRIAMLADPFGHGFCLLEMNALGYDAPGI